MVQVFQCERFPKSLTDVVTAQFSAYKLFSMPGMAMNSLEGEGQTALVVACSKSFIHNCEPHMSRVVRKPVFFAYAKTKTQISFAVTAKLISAFVFATRIVQPLSTS